MSIPNTEFPCDDEDDCNQGSGSGLPPYPEEHNKPTQYKQPPPKEYPDPEGTDSSKCM